MSTFASNGQTPRITYYPLPQEIIDQALECDDVSEGDDSDIDPPFDYSAPEDDSDRNGGSDDRKGYECPD